MVISAIAGLMLMKSYRKIAVCKSDGDLSNKIIVITGDSTGIDK